MINTETVVPVRASSRKPSPRSRPGGGPTTISTQLGSLRSCTWRRVVLRQQCLGASGRSKRTEERILSLVLRGSKTSHWFFFQDLFSFIWKVYIHTLASRLLRWAEKNILKRQEELRNQSNLDKQKQIFISVNITVQIILLTVQFLKYQTLGNLKKWVSQEPCDRCVCMKIMNMYKPWKKNLEGADFEKKNQGKQIHRLLPPCSVDSSPLTVTSLTPRVPRRLRSILPGSPSLSMCGMAVTAGHATLGTIWYAFTLQAKLMGRESYGMVHSMA